MIQVSKKVYKDIENKVGAEKLRQHECNVSTPDSAAVTSTPAVANEIIRLHAEIEDHLKLGLEKATRIGELLFEQKEKEGHGRFSSWIRDNLTFSQRSAQRYMKLFLHREQLKNDSVSFLTEAYNAIEGKPNLGEVIDADDSVKVEDWKVVGSRVESIELPKKIQGSMTDLVLSKQTLKELKEDGFFRNAAGTYTKLVLKPA